MNVAKAIEAYQKYVKETPKQTVNVNDFLAGYNAAMKDFIAQLKAERKREK